MMTSKSALTLMDCSIEDGSRKNNNDNDVRDTSLFSCTIVGESNTSSTLFEGHGDNRQKNDYTTKSSANNKSKLRATQETAMSASRKENNLSVTTNERVMAHSSQVWQYAIRCPDSNYSTCCLCSDNKRISTHNGSTSTLRKHLITKHNLHELALPNNKRKGVKSSINTQRQQELNSLCIYCIIRDGRTFNDLQKPGIKRLLQELIPGYEPPSRNTVARRLKRLHVLYFKKLVDELTHIDYISITLDFWSNQQMKSFMVITGHYFSTDNFQLKSTVLNFSVVDTAHNSNEISKLLRAKLKELNILHKIVSVTVDGAANMIRAIDDTGLGLKRIWCIAHRLHLTIINAFGFWMTKRQHFQENVTLEMTGLTNHIVNNQEDHMMNMEKFQNDDELDEVDTTLSEDIESENDQLSDKVDISDEESLLDVTDEQIIDNWIPETHILENNTIYEQDMIACIVGKCRALVLMIKSSTILTLFIDKQRGKLNIKRNLCYDVKSRWNSTYNMIDRFLVLREVIENLFNQKHSLLLRQQQIKKLGTLELKSDDWIMLSALHTVLKPFFHATKVLSGRDYPSIGLAFYLLSRLKCFLQKQDKKENIMIKGLKQLLLSQFVHYFESDDDQAQLLKLHSYFDPAGFMTLTNCEKALIEQSLRKMITNNISYFTDSVVSVKSIVVQTNKAVNKQNLRRTTRTSIIDAFNESIGEVDYTETERDGDRNETIAEDIRKYRNCATQFNSTYQIDATSSTLFWQTYAQGFPKLAKLARKFLSTPATSVPSESCFSMSSFLARKERSRLTGDNLAASVFLKDKINY